MIMPLSREKMRDYMRERRLRLRPAEVVQILESLARIEVKLGTLNDCERLGEIDKLVEKVVRMK